MAALVTGVTCGTFTADAAAAVIPARSVLTVGNAGLDTFAFEALFAPLAVLVVYAACVAFAHRDDGHAGTLGSACVVVGVPVGPTDGVEVAVTFTVRRVLALTVDAALALVAIAVSDALGVVGARAVGEDLSARALGEASVAVGDPVVAADQGHDIGAIASAPNALIVDAALIFGTFGVGAARLAAAFAVLRGDAVGRELCTGADVATEGLGRGTLSTTVRFVLTLSAVSGVVADPVPGEAFAVSTAEGAVDAGLTVDLVAVVTAVNLAVTGDAAVGAGAVIALNGAGGAARGRLTEAVVVTGCVAVTAAAAAAAAVVSAFAAVTATHTRLFALAVDALLALFAVTVAFALGGVGALSIGDHLGPCAFGEAGVPVGEPIIAADRRDNIGAITALVDALAINTALILCTVTVSPTRLGGTLTVRHGAAGR